MFPTLRTLGVALAAIGLGALSPVRAADAPAASKADAPGKKRVVFIAGKPSHGYAQHEQHAGCLLLAKCLNEGMPGVETQVYKAGWPADEHAFDGAAAVVIFCDGGGGHLALPHLKELDALAERGIGIGCIHYAVEVPKDKGGPELTQWIGGYFETFWSVNPHWTAYFADVPKHPIASGVRPFATNDEWYYHMRFRENMEGVTSILAAVPPDSTRSGKDDAHGGNPAVRADVGKNVKETVLWVAERPNHQRGFGCTGAHFHFNWAQDDFRKTVLNSIVWIAHEDVPAGGVKSTRPTVDELTANLDDKKVPADFKKEDLAKKIEQMNEPPAPAKADPR